jgi:GT2 family glycosyltransferase
MADGASIKTSGPTFSLVFLTWNSEADIERTIDSVLEQTYTDFEVVVVDNDSDDETVPLVKANYGHRKDVRLIVNESNLGFSRGTNRGIDASRGEYICCYNDDTHFPPDYLEALAEHVAPDAVLTTARINHRVTEEHQTVRLLTGHRFPIPYVVDSLTGVAEVNYVPGDGLIIPREIYTNRLEETVFDPDMPARGEDLDLSLRLRANGIEMRAVLDTHSIHPYEGFYSPTVENGMNHLRNVDARFRAYKKNGFGIATWIVILVSSISVPIEIYFRSFPRESDDFKCLTALSK